MPSYIPATCVQTPGGDRRLEMIVFPVVNTTDISMFPLWIPSENDVWLLSRLMTIGWFPETVFGWTQAATATLVDTVN